ncbi:MAG TPA: hypothetical protein VNB52_03380, partial [Ilumatobacteraceae bacterium]|nr:hypothetical protein [Ilumatobacteraceae bacterium]
TKGHCEPHGASLANPALERRRCHQPWAIALTAIGVDARALDIDTLLDWPAVATKSETVIVAALAMRRAYLEQPEETGAIITAFMTSH